MHSTHPASSARLPVTIADVTPKIEVKAVPGRRWSRRRLWRAAAMALGHLVLAFAVVSGVGQSGARYFYCEAFGLMATDPCVQASQASRGPFEALDTPLADCCEVVTLPAMPEGARVASWSVPSAGCAAVLPAAVLIDPWSSRGHQLQSPERQRWRPPPRAPSEVRAQLMVFLA